MVRRFPNGGQKPAASRAGEPALSGAVNPALPEEISMLARWGEV